MFLSFSRTVVLMFSSAVIYNKTQFRHETERKKNQKSSSKQHFPFLISTSQRQPNCNCHTAAELTDKEHFPPLEPMVPFVWGVHQQRLQTPVVVFHALSKHRGSDLQGSHNSFLVNKKPQPFSSEQSYFTWGRSAISSSSSFTNIKAPKTKKKWLPIYQVTIMFLSSAYIENVQVAHLMLQCENKSVLKRHMKESTSEN